MGRAALGSTVIGAGTKIDNLVHVAHNVVMGRHCLVMGQSGFAGSTSLGDYVVIASQAGIAGHLKLGNQSMVGAKSGVMRDIPDGGKVLGFPAMPAQQAKRQVIAAQQLPEMVHRLRALEKQVETQVKIATEHAHRLSQGRKTQVAGLEDKVNALLKKVGMPNARIQVKLSTTLLNSFGQD